MIACILNRQRWKVYRVNRLGPGGTGAFGDCDFEKKTIRVVRGIDPLDELDTFIHEALHATRPELDEDAVVTTATDIARLLWKIGYRRSDT